MKIYRVWRKEYNKAGFGGDVDMGLYVAHSEREACAYAFNDTTGTSTPDHFRAERWVERPSVLPRCISNDG